MRKTIFLFALAAGTSLLIPFITLADTGGKAEARLTLNVVIDISVTDNWDPLTIKLADLAGWGAGAVIDWDTGNDDIEVTVKALTDFKVWASYYASVPSTDFGNADELLGLYDDDNNKIYWLKYYQIADPKKFTGKYSDLKDLEFTGSNNLSDGGTTKDYEVKLKPENLGDRAAGETIDFTIVFVVEDPTT